MAKPGATITIDGRGFGATKGTVYFGSTAVTGANITAWEDTQIKVKIPAIAGGVYNIKVANSAGTSSNVHDNFEVLTGDQVSVRFVVNNATTALGQNVYLAGGVSELGNGILPKPSDRCTTRSSTNTQPGTMTSAYRPAKPLNSNS